VFVRSREVSELTSASHQVLQTLFWLIDAGCAEYDGSALPAERGACRQKGLYLGEDRKPICNAESDMTQKRKKGIQYGEEAVGLRDAIMAIAGSIQF
jgi:hypothetical protein